MEKEFIPYEQALELKELGFDEPCFGAWVNNELFITENENPKIQSLSINQCTTPLYQQAFRWFREKYDLDSFVKHLYKSKIKVGYYFGMDEYKGIDFQMYLDDYYKTYEEAQLECLKKLIKIIR